MTNNAEVVSGEQTSPTLNSQPCFKWAVPEELGIPPDALRLRLDFYHQAVEMTIFEDDTVTSRVVSAMDVAHALSSELSFGSGLLPPNALWWRSTRSGQVVAIYEAPRTRILTLQTDVNNRPKRYAVPLPGLIFICKPSTPPWVYAVKRKPTKETDIIYAAPLANLFADGRSCPGSHEYPNRVADMVESFFTSWFSPTAALHDRSKKFQQNVLLLWAFLDKKKRFPMDDLVKLGTVRDLLNMQM